MRRREYHNPSDAESQVLSGSLITVVGSGNPRSGYIDPKGLAQAALTKIPGG
jgi:hypothetical protein